MKGKKQSKSLQKKKHVLPTKKESDKQQTFGCQ